MGEKEMVRELTLREQIKARKIVKQILASPTQTLLGARKRLVKEGETDLIEMVDHVLSLRGVKV